MTNEQLVARIKDGENTAENMALLYGQVKAFIHTIAWKYRGKEELEDLEQEGFLALYDAIEGYDLECEVKFITYAEYWMKLRMIRYIQNKGKCLRLPVNLQERIRQYTRYCNEYWINYHRAPTEGEIKAHLGLSQAQLRMVKEKAIAGRIESLDNPGPDKEEKVGDFIPDSFNLEEDVVERVQRQQLSEKLWRLVDSLESRQSYVIHKRYQKGLTLREIGNELGVTIEAVRQAEKKGICGLRKARNIRELEPFIYSMGIRGNGSNRFQRTWTSSTERTAIKLAEGTRNKKD